MEREARPRLDPGGCGSARGPSGLLALQIADRGYVLETGSIALQGSAAELASNEQVQRVYLGG